MNLRKLSGGGVPGNKNIICIGRSEKHLEELCDQFQAVEKIVAVLDGNPRNIGVLRLRGREIPVYALEPENLERLDLSDTVLVITDDYFRECYDKLKALSGSGDPGTVYFFADRETEYDLFYREKYRAAPLEDCIVFRSGPRPEEYVKGMDFADNARALFEYALSAGLNRKYRLVWMVKNPEEFKAYEAYDNVSFLPFAGAAGQDEEARERYYRALCLARFIFFTDAYGFARNCRKDQVRVQLWHGCGFKRRLNSVACMHRYDYMTVTSGLYADLHAKEFGLRADQMLVTGCAKEDWLFQGNGDAWDKLNLPAAEKYIFWLPTYRFSGKEKRKPADGRLCAETGLPLVSSLRELELIDRELGKRGMVLAVKLHPFQDRQAVHVGGFSNIVLLEHETLAENDIQVNQLLGRADALISDYSSAAVDYLVLDRPMAFIVDDLEGYSGRRGFIFENIQDWLPGRLVRDAEGLLAFIGEIGEGTDSTGGKRKALRAKMHRYGDGNNCRRILESLGVV